MISATVRLHLALNRTPFIPSINLNLHDVAWQATTSNLHCFIDVIAATEGVVHLTLVSIML